MNLLSDTLWKSARDLDQLLQAKSLSDRKRYAEKSRVVRAMLERKPQDWEIDSREGRFVGLTHLPTGFKLHLPASQVQLPEAKQNALVTTG